MSTLVQKVSDLLGQSDIDRMLNDPAIRQAEILADQFKDVRPVPFIVPIERYMGLPTETGSTAPDQDKHHYPV